MSWIIIYMIWAVFLKFLEVSFVVILKRMNKTELNRNYTEGFSFQDYQLSIRDNIMTYSSSTVKGLLSFCF